MSAIERVKFGSFFIDRPPMFDDWIFHQDERLLVLETKAESLLDQIRELRRKLQKPQTKSQSRFLQARLKSHKEALQAVQVEKTLIE